MRKLLCYAIIGSISFSCFAQGEFSEKQFKALPIAQKELYLRVIKADSLTNNRINDYLYVNGEEKRIVKENSTVFVLTDVVNGKPIYTTTDNLNAAKSTETDHLQIGGDMGLDLDGAGLTVRVWDGGAIQNTHPEFKNLDNSASRVTNIEVTNTDGTSNLSTHATHVTGIIAAKGDTPSAKGMATAILTINYNFNNDSPEMVVEVNNATNPMYLSNHSYGIPINQAGGEQLDPWIMGAYTSEAREIDDIARSNPKYLIVSSAGNGVQMVTLGLVSGIDKLTGDKNAKNNLVIANASPTLSPFNDDVTFVINSSSSQGPTDDLRIKPDIAGDGTGLMSTALDGGYVTLTGTSMSSPNVTGSLALLQQYYNQLNGDYMNASTLKGLACHTATDDTSIIGPDPYFGWGLLNSKRSAEVIMGSSNGLTIINELKIDDGTTYSLNFGAQAGDKLSATLCWTDVKGIVATSSADLNNQTPRLVNDLDLRITQDGGATFLPWKLTYSGSSISNTKADNNVDNVERVDIDVPETGNYTLVVSHKGTLQAAAPFDPQSQDFSLIVTGNNLTLGVQDNTLSNSLQLYPNPSKGKFTISFNGNSSNTNDVKVCIYDLSGRQVYNNIFINTSLRFNETINLEGILAGVYIANVTQGNSSISHKLVVE